MTFASLFGSVFFGLVEALWLDPDSSLGHTALIGCRFGMVLSALELVRHLATRSKTRRTARANCRSTVSRQREASIVYERSGRVPDLWPPTIGCRIATALGEQRGNVHRLDRGASCSSLFAAVTSERPELIACHLPFLRARRSRCANMTRRRAS